ncbi:MAG: KGG domain-containing protein [Massilia sp.]
MATSNQGNKQSGSEGGSQGGGTKNRGFASMDPERQRQIASEGGKAAHQKGTAHEFTSEEARRAGSMSHGNRQSAESSSDSSARAASKTGAKAGSKQATSAGSKQSEGGGNKSGGTNKSR